MRDLLKIKFWLFDLDNTLYDGATKVFDQVDKEISKTYKKLDFILNTHHHNDHVDGNINLKKKYNSKILGSHADKNRIPGIDILLEENQKHKIGNLEFEYKH